MTDITTKVTDKAQQAADHYISKCIIAPMQGYSWAQAMRDAGYAESTINKKSNETWGIVGVQEQIAEAKARLKRDSLNTIAKIRAKHEEFMTLAIEKGDLALARLNLQDLGRTYAAYTDKNIVDNEINISIQRYAKAIEANVTDTPALAPVQDCNKLESSPVSRASGKAE